MSSLKYNFHTVCSDCQGLDCDLETRCIEWTDVSDVIMTNYLSHKLLAKHEHEVPLPSSVVVHEPEIFAGDPPLAEPASPSVVPVMVTTAFNSLSDVQSVVSNLVTKVKSMFGCFAESL